MKYSNSAFIFPGQGAQYKGMGKEFFTSFSTARETFQEADDILERNLSKIIFEGPDDVLTQTKNSQCGIFVTSVAILRVLQELIPEMKPRYCAGLSLGEYSALFSSGHISFKECLHLVQLRGQFMNDACESTKGTMAVVLGLDAEMIESTMQELNLPRDIWIANFNCPGQIVISGTEKGIHAATIALKEKGAKRVLPLQVHGAFHSGLMVEAQKRLEPYIDAAFIHQGTAALMMNVPAQAVTDIAAMKKNLVDQVTHPVRWEQSVQTLVQQGVDLFVEIGPGKTLSGFNKRIHPTGLTLNVQVPGDLENIK